MVRDQLSEEIWVELNSIYHFFRNSDAEGLFKGNSRQFYRRLLRFSLVFQGLSDSTVHHDEGWRFMSLGKYLERADQTSRVIDALTMKGTIPSRSDLISALRICSALTPSVNNTGGTILEMWPSSFSFPKIFHAPYGFPSAGLTLIFMICPVF